MGCLGSVALGCLGEMNHAGKCDPDLIVCEFTDSILARPFASPPREGALVNSRQTREFATPPHTLKDRLEGYLAVVHDEIVLIATSTPKDRSAACCFTRLTLVKVNKLSTVMGFSR